MDLDFQWNQGRLCLASRWNSGHLLLTFYLVSMVIQQRNSHSLTNLKNRHLDSLGLRVWITPVGKLPEQVVEGPQNTNRMDSTGWKQCALIVVSGPTEAMGTVFPTNLVSAPWERNQLQTSRGCFLVDHKVGTEEGPSVCHLDLPISIKNFFFQCWFPLKGFPLVKWSGLTQGQVPLLQAAYNQRQIHGEIQGPAHHSPSLGHIWKIVMALESSITPNDPCAATALQSQFFIFPILFLFLRIYCNKCAACKSLSQS